MAFLVRAIFVWAMAAACLQAAETVRVLFVGNSYTFFNDLPGMIAAMGDQRGVRFACVMRAEGSASLFSHWQNGAGRELQTGKFDFVVLQDQSVIPSLQPEQTIRYGGAFCRAAREARCRPVFLLTWARLSPSTRGRQAFDGEMQRKLSLAYSRAAVEGQARVAPAGEAWRRAYATIPNCRLHLEDGSHPNVYGTYLAACVLYTTLTGQPSLGLPGKLAPPKSGGRLLCRLSSERARALQLCADRTTAAFSPETCLQRHQERQSRLPSRAAVAAGLRRGMEAREVDALAGAPVFIDRETQNRQYRLQDGVEFSAVFNTKGRLLAASFSTPEGRVEVLDWRERSKRPARATSQERS